MGTVAPPPAPTLLASSHITLGTACTTENDRLDTATGKFSSDSDDASFCSGVGGTNGTCQPRECRRDEFPFGFANATVPPLCPRESYCPDEGSGCRPLVAAGQPCQEGRDDQCAPPGSWQELASGLNANGSLCLNSVCMYVLRC